MSDEALPEKPAPTPTHRRGAWVGRYVLLDPIAEGGMGVVYAAFDSQLDRKVAIKLLRPTLTKGENTTEAEARMLREAQAMARLSHPNVVAIHDVGIVEGNVFLAMEYVEGGTLKDRLAHLTSWREGLALLKEAGRGLAAAHAAGLIHRDFKPDNVLVGSDGRVRVTDFGIARAEEGASPRAPTDAERRSSGHRKTAPTASLASTIDAAADGNSPAAGVLARSPAAVSRPRSKRTSSGRALAEPLTLTGDLLGTVGYMAPEQAFGERIDARSDQFSFCATLYLALYGEKPFRDPDVDSYLAALTGPVRDAPAGTKVPQWLRRVVLKGLSLFPAGRYDSMDALLGALEHDPAVARRRWLGIGALAVAGAAAGYAYHRAEETRTARCGSAEADLDGVWDPAVKEDTRRAFDATGVATRADSFDRVAKTLDAYARTWRSARTEVCEATKIRHEESEEVYALRAECLDREKTELRALTSLFRSVDKGELEQSVKAAYGLTAVSWCQDVNALRASPGLPVEPTRRAAVLEARAALASGASLGLAGKYADAKGEAERARRQAQEAGHRGTEAEALFQIGYDENRLGHYDEAATSLADAMASAYGAGNDAVFIRAASRLAFIAGDKLYHPADAQRLLGLARGGLDRVGGSDVLEADVLSTDAVLLVAQGYPERAAPILERVVRFYRTSLGEHPTTAIQLNNLGYAEHLASENLAAQRTLRESHGMFVALFGTENLTAGIPLCNLGASSLVLGNLPDAERYLEQSLAIFERESPDGYWTGWALQYLALRADLETDPDAALAFGHRGLAIADRLSSSQRLLPGLSVTTADALLQRGARGGASDASGTDARGRPNEALALCERALDVQQRTGLVDPARTYDWDALRCRGEALLALGRRKDAIASLESSVVLPRRVFPWDLARARFALARALVAEDRPRALALAQKARAELASLPQAKAFLRDVDAWLRAVT